MGAHVAVVVAARSPARPPGAAVVAPPSVDPPAGIAAQHISIFDLRVVTNISNFPKARTLLSDLIPWVRMKKRLKIAGL